MKDTFKTAFRHGGHARAVYGLLRQEQLYRRPWLLRLAWRLGWEISNLLTDQPLRTGRR